MPKYSHCCKLALVMCMLLYIVETIKYLYNINTQFSILYVHFWWKKCIFRGNQDGEEKNPYLRIYP